MDDFEEDELTKNFMECYGGGSDIDVNESRCVIVLNMVLSVVASLNIILPTATIIAFTVLTPLFTSHGRCDHFSRWLLGGFLLICATSSVFLCLTDSYRSASGRLYYGVATFSGIWMFNGGSKSPLEPKMYKLSCLDLFNATIAILAFLAFAAFNRDVVECFQPTIPRKVIDVVALAVSFVVSVLFVLYPSNRRGIGYPLLLHNDLFSFRG